MQAPGLAVVIVGERKDSQTYVRVKKKACEEVGIASFGADLPETATQQEVLDTVAQLNADPNVHGILVQLPVSNADVALQDEQHLSGGRTAAEQAYSVYADMMCSNKHVVRQRHGLPTAVACCHSLGSVRGVLRIELRHAPLLFAFVSQLNTKAVPAPAIHLLFHLCSCPGTLMSSWCCQPYQWRKTSMASTPSTWDASA
jgi:hypothetical protein